MLKNTPVDRYVVIGNPIAQSKSPLIHAHFAQLTGQVLDYQTLLAPDDGFESAVQTFRASGGRGMNVTAPFKLQAAALATQASPSVQISGAANALKFDGEHVLAENFDGVGLVNDLERNQRLSLQGRRVLMLGAGGAARGALLPLLAGQPAQLVIANRTFSKALTLAALGQAHGAVRASSYPELEGQTFDLVLNATSASLRGELPPVPVGVFEGCVLAYELAYGKGLTPFLRLAQSGGASRLVDGVGMLAEQAAKAFHWWRGVRPPTTAIMAQLSVPLV